MLQLSNKKNNVIFLGIFISLGILFYIGYLFHGFPMAKGQIQGQGKEVFVMYAGSLVKIFETSLGSSFQNQTGYTYEGEGKGSVQIADLMVDGFRKPDIFVSAGTIPIMKLVDNKPPLANWLIKFASTEMVISYSPKSHFYNELEKVRTGQIPWYKVISEKDFKSGRTDPELGPEGYNMIISAKLSDMYYNDSSIKQTILGDDRNPKQVYPEETLNTILESGQVDAISAYKHEAISRELPYITLPAQINLGDSDYSNYYKKASYTFTSNISGSGGGVNNRIVYGEPIYFSVTIPNTYKNFDAAVSFVNHLISPNDKGKLILEKQGLDYLKTPIIEGNINKIPSTILSVAK